MSIQPSEALISHENYKCSLSFSVVTAPSVNWFNKKPSCR